MIAFAEQWRKTLLRVGWIYGLNARIKARATLREYRQTLEHYRDRPSRALRPPCLKAWAGGKTLQILFVGTDEQQDRSGILQALERCGRLRYFTRADGSYGQNDPRSARIRAAANAARLWELVEQAATADEPPNILIAQTWATLTEPEVFSRIRERHGTMVVNISMDDRHQYRGRKINRRWDGTYPLIPHLDLALTSAPECVEWYEKEGCPALFFPEASDPAIFHPIPDLPKLHDVSFVGARYGIREEIVTALRYAGVKVAAYGNGWEGGRIATEDVPRLFAQSRIVLGVGTIGHCRDFYALKMRDFDGPMSGSLYATHDNPDLHALFEPGREIVLFRDTADCVEKVRYYLAHDAEREAHAAAGRARAVREHTWYSRFSRLFALLQGPGKSIVGAAEVPQ